MTGTTSCIRPSEHQEDLVEGHEVHRKGRGTEIHMQEATLQEDMDFASKPDNPAPVRER